MSSELMTKYLVGWMFPANMLNKDWQNVWYSSAKAAADNDCEVVAFRIPKNRTGGSNGEIIAQIEKLLQEEFSK